MARYNLEALGEPIFFTPPNNRSRFDSRSLYKGGGDAPDPDPNVGIAALMNARLGQQQFDFFKQEYINNLPRMQEADELANEVQRKLIESADLQNTQARDYYDYMINTFRPLEKDLVQKANEYDSTGRREAEAAKGVSDVRQAFDVQRGMAQRNNERMGINPNSGNSLALGQQMDVQEAIAGANAANTGRNRAEQMGTAMKYDAVSLGRGLPSNSLASMQAANAAATGAVGVSTQNQANQRASLGVMNQGFQGAMQGYTNQANILNADYQNRLNAWQANQNSSNSLWGGVGQLAGTLGSAWIMASDKKIKKGVRDYDEEEALEEVKNTEVKSWEYDEAKAPSLADGKRHVGAMAQDVQQNMGDDVSNGKEIDVISLVGKNMAATKALSEKVDQIASQLSLGDMKKGRVEMKNGGKVKGKGSEKVDSIDAKLAPNEFVLNAGAVRVAAEEEGMSLGWLNDLNKRGLDRRKG